jgi:hypothetical protein
MLERVAERLKRLHSRMLCVCDVGIAATRSGGMIVKNHNDDECGRSAAMRLLRLVCCRVTSPKTGFETTFCMKNFLRGASYLKKQMKRESYCA